jgi:hypothetical protein
MAIRYELRLVDGEDAGTYDTNLSNWEAGVRQPEPGVPDHRDLTIQRIQDFLDRPDADIWGSSGCEARVRTGATN